MEVVNVINDVDTEGIRAVLQEDLLHGKTPAPLPGLTAAESDSRRRALDFFTAGIPVTVIGRDGSRTVLE